MVRLGYLTLDYSLLITVFSHYYSSPALEVSLFTESQHCACSGSRTSHTRPSGWVRFALCMVRFPHKDLLKRTQWSNIARVVCRQNKNNVMSDLQIYKFTRNTQFFLSQVHHILQNVHLGSIPNESYVRAFYQNFSLSNRNGVVSKGNAFRRWPVKPNDSPHVRKLERLPQRQATSTKMPVSWSTPPLIKKLSRRKSCR